MYWSEISMRFSAGRSTPEMRAIRSGLRFSASPGLALTLFVAGVGGADDPHHALALHDLALVADLLHRRADLHDLFTRPIKFWHETKRPADLADGTVRGDAVPRTLLGCLTHPSPRHRADAKGAL